jgi:hypothetical protein
MKVLPAAFMIALGAVGFVRAESVVGPTRHQAASVSPTSDITEDPGPISTVWKHLQSRIPLAATADLTEDPSPIGPVWKRLRGGPRPTLDIVEDPTPINTVWKRLRLPGLFPTDQTTTITSDPIEVMYVFYFIESDPAPILLIAEPN